MDAMWARLLEVERRVTRYLVTIRDLQRQVATLQQQLAAARSN